MKRDSFSSFSSSLDHLSILSSSTRDRSPSPPPSSSGDPVLFFAYGPIVHNLVRKRRNIRTTNLQPAFLDGYRLSFEFGGIANVVRSRGYRVHGVLMTLASLRDLKKMKAYDIRRQVTQRLVFQYPKNGFVIDEDDLDEQEEKEQLESAMAYFIEYPEDVQDSCQDNSTNPATMERLPQEGYLRLIAEGMQQNRVCYEYIDDSILNIPYIPDRSESDYLKFPRAPKVAKISFGTYQDLCDNAQKGDIYFVLGNSVFMLGTHNSNNPLAIWLEEHGHGRDDVTFFLQIVLMNTSLAFCKTRSEVTKSHIEWAENQLVETIQQHGLDAKKVFEFIQDDEPEDGPSKFFTLDEEATVRPSSGEFTSLDPSRMGSFTSPSSIKKRLQLPAFLKRRLRNR